MKETRARKFGMFHNLRFAGRHGLGVRFYIQSGLSHVGAKVLTATTTNSAILYVTSFRPVEVYRRFRESYWLHLQDRTVSQASNKQS
jgi:hypothetical protein